MAVQKLTTSGLRRGAVAQSLFQPASLQEAVNRLGFVQADPIRAPARAQDLILRHRVVGYQAGDLERRYPSLDIEEDYLYAYGFLSRRVWNLLHPRKAGPLRALERRVLAAVDSLGDAHPRQLEAQLGKRRVVNAWGGYSKATTDALEWLHWRGLLRIARRENGIRVYRRAAAPLEPLESGGRLRALIRALAHIFAPAPEPSLRALIARYRDLGNPGKTLAGMIADGELRRDLVEGLAYLWPASMDLSGEAHRQVRFLAPFDPIVWDRRRFDRFWGWPYRFEAYTPLAKRVRGYYAMPILWGDEIPGWANASIERGRLNIALGWVARRPRSREFARELDAEIARVQEFLNLKVERGK